MHTVRASWSSPGVSHQQNATYPTENRDHLLGDDELVINNRSHEVLLGGVIIDLTKTEFDLLRVMATHPRRVFTTRQLFQSVWSSNFFDADHVVETHVSRLRRKLGESGTHPRYIHTVRGVGYRFEPHALTQPDHATRSG
jgi:DNA-binding response OmpR family regulator